MSYGLPIYKVNTATLALFVEYPIFKAECVNLEIDLSISFHSFNTYRGIFGEGWQFSNSSYISLDPMGGKLLLKKGSGQMLQFEASQGADLTNGRYCELKSLNRSKGRLFEYQGYYLFYDWNREQISKYVKTAGSKPSYLRSITDNFGNGIQINYRSEGVIERISDSFGREIKFFYDSLPYCTGIILPDGRETDISYDVNGRIQRIVNFDGVATTFSYDGNAMIESIAVGKKQKTTRFLYARHEELNLVHKVTDRNGGTTQYSLISIDPVTVQVIDPMGYEKKYISRNGLTEKIIYSDGSISEARYVNHLPVVTVDRNGNEIQMQYDTQGNMTSRVDALGNSETFLYDIDGNLSEYKDALGRITRYVYGEKKNLLQTVSANGRKTEYHYDGAGRIISANLPTGNVMRYEYDAYSNIVAISDILGDVYKAVYDESGYQRLQCTDANGNKTEMKYDGTDRLTEIKNSKGVAKTYEYDCCATMVIRDELGNTWVFERDGMSNISKEIDPMSEIKGYHYNAAGRLIREIDEAGNETAYQYNGSGHVTEITNAQGAVVYKKYDPNGNMLEVTDENQNSFVFTHSKKNQVKKVTDPKGNTVVYGYDAVGNTTFVITPGKHKISFIYDSENNAVQKLIDDKPVAELNYNASKGITQIVEAAGQIQYEYDVRGRMIKAIYPQKREVSFEYDPENNLTRLNYPKGLEVRYTYDSEGHMTCINWAENEIQMAYDDAGRLVAEKRSNKTQSHYEYDACHRPVLINHRSQKEDENLAFMKYVYDNVGNIVEESCQISLLDNNSENTEMDSLSLRYNSLNQMVQKNKVSYQYDTDGNLTAVDGKHFFSFQYDEESRLVGKKSAQGEVKYEYNVLNQLVKVVRNGKVTLSCFDLRGRVIFEADEQGNDAKCYIYSDERLVAMVKEDGAVYFYHCDQRGNITVVSDKNGEAVCAYSYLPYGAVLKKAERINDNQFTFMGAYGVTDENDGLYMTDNRLYDSSTGRFIQQDPLGFIDGQNLYAYAGGNPITKIDPEGTFALTIALGIGALYAGYKTYTSIKAGAESCAKYSEALKKLDKARNIREQYWKLYLRGKITERQLYQAEDYYKHALNQAAKQAGETGKTLVKEHALPGGTAGEFIKDVDECFRR